MHLRPRFSAQSSTPRVNVTNPILHSPPPPHANPHAQVVLEGNLVNLDVTGPAATLALALIFLKTNDAAIAAAFVIPDTHYALDYVRPDFILLRMLARSLVMWDSVEPSHAWVLDQLPPLIKVGQLVNPKRCIMNAKNLQ